MSYPLLQRLSSVNSEYLVCYNALQYIAQEWPQFAGTQLWEERSFSEVREALNRLEGTYIIRIFSEFEGCLQFHLTRVLGFTHIPRTAEAMINRVALREHIPDPIRLAAHQVREYRNSLVHMDARRGITLSFGNVRRALNQFLVALPS